MTKPTAEYLRSILDYEPETGLFVWRVQMSNAAPKAGTFAGRRNASRGYAEIGVGGKLYRAHRLAWLHVTGHWPDSHLDHVNGNRSDNRWSNLRLATRQQNNWNRGKGKNNKSGFKGVSFDRPSSKWKAQICVNYTKISLGLFDTPIEASACYQGAAELLHGGWTRIVELLDINPEGQPTTHL